MKKNKEKPSPEAKALSLFLMAYKTIKPVYKEKAKRINRSWDLVKSGDMSQKDYDKEVTNMSKPYGGYEKLVEKTVRFYIKKTGEWTLKGDDKYCIDAQEVADRVLNEKPSNPTT